MEEKRVIKGRVWMKEGSQTDSKKDCLLMVMTGLEKRGIEFVVDDLGNREWWSDEEDNFVIAPLIEVRYEVGRKS